MTVTYPPSRWPSLIDAAVNCATAAVSCADPVTAASIYARRSELYRAAEFVRADERRRA